MVDDPAEAQVAIVRAATPHETLFPGYVFGSFLHEGRLDFRDGQPDGQPEYEAIKQISARVPTTLTVYLDRPAILTRVRDRVSALIGPIYEGTSTIQSQTIAKNLLR